MEYEVRCDHCDVSFPVGTRQCIHCGGRIRKSSTPQGAVRAVPLDPSEGGGVGPTSGRGEFTDGHVFPPDVHEDEDEESPRMSRVRMVMNGMWVLFIALAMLARYCAGGGG